MNKICTRCHIDKPLTDFHNHKKGRLGKAEQCKICTSKYNAIYREKNRRSLQEYKLKSNFGLAYSDYIDMWHEQNGQCKICGDFKELEGYANSRLHVDHCHTTGKIRSLLCHRCNRALGLFKDDLSILESAYSYIAFFQCNQ